MGKSDAENQLFTNQIKKEEIMANYRKRYSKMTGKWTPVAAVSKTLSTRKIAERIEKESTVSYTDIMAVLTSLPTVMQRYLAEGHPMRFRCN